jgi:glycosyltransferase involved in cell wall biosynthesis
MAQIYILPSQSDFEGFPRTIWEAMANSLPVVATRVGSIPYFVQNEMHILMVEPRNIEALYTAVKNVIEDKKLRETLILNSYNFAKEITLEKQTKLLIDILKVK